MQQQRQHDELVLRMDVSIQPDVNLNYEQAANILGQAARTSNQKPYWYTYIDKPGDGEMHVIFQVPSLPPFNVDGLRYLEQEHVYRVPIGPYELEVAETKYGFIPGSGEQHASRVRRKMRFSKGGVGAVVLVHYLQGPSCAIPPPYQNQPVRRYPLPQNLEPGIFCLGERTGQKVPNPNAQGMMNGQISLHQQFGPGGPRMPGVNPQLQQQNAALAAQQAALNNIHRSGAPAKPMQMYEDPEEDESDVITQRDIATARFIRNHEFLADLFGPESAPKPLAIDESPEKVSELEATLAKLNEEMELLQKKSLEVEAMAAHNVENDAMSPALAV
ncbi:hypothetical protein FRB94_000846 [Tulasnella sp. JGI-2019a]|nr:hypothetical protein FRB94_000846 [Tulasnella sp. JGI-2019a]KAG9014494.1 hypothetical protein FRB93_013619 [Tulasnella sp. JGI-2019a]KAG9039749.1 hypothetical protein FRB95_007176 [Tulasnella sp. JGI-2019a]